jgi:hypothetical protein
MMADSSSGAARRGLVIAPTDLAVREELGMPGCVGHVEGAEVGSREM